MPITKEPVLITPMRKLTLLPVTWSPLFTHSLATIIFFTE